MIVNRKMNSVKRIAFAAGDINRKALIEWSYYNQDILKVHELIATGMVADILEGTVGVPVTKLQEGIAAANHQLAVMASEQKLDIILFFWDPLQLLQQVNGIRHLHDTAIANNIIVAPNLATADFVLSSSLIDKSHSVPVLNELPQVTTDNYYSVDRRVRQAVLKVNTIN